MRWMVLMSAVFLSGCVVHYSGQRNEGPPPLRATTLEQVNSMAGAQQPSAYKVGFMQGCDSGRLSAGDNSYLFKKDVDRFSTDDVYQQGWNDGYDRCASGEGAPPATYQSTNSYFGFGYYPYYYPRVFYSGGYYYPGYYDYYPYYSSSYSIRLGGYGHTDRAHRHHYYASPWYGGHKHKGGGQHFSRWNSHKGSGSFYRGKHRGGGHGKVHKGSSGKSHSGKGRGHKGGGRGHKGGSPWRP